VRYLVNNFDAIGGMDELMQMAVIELVRKEAKTEGSNRVSSQHPVLTRADN
jgi:coatomer subunit beta